MKKINTFCYSLTLVITFLFSSFLSFGQNDLNTKINSSKSCGEKVFNYLKDNYYPSTESNYILPGKNEHTLAEMLEACKSLSDEAQAIKCKVDDLFSLPKPIILHLNFEHYILLEEYKNESFSIFDPSAKHLKRVSQSYLEQNCSLNAIVLNATRYDSKVFVDGKADAIGGWDVLTPPNQNDDGHNDGDSEDNEYPNGCPIYPTGSPIISFNPIVLNIVVVDIPMWFKTGIGPDIELKMVYNSNNQQEYSGAASTPTQYFPSGKSWSFAYGAFYNEQSADVITLIMPDGARQTFSFTGNSSTPAHSDYHNNFERYNVTGGYGYSLTFKDTKLKYRFDNPAHGKLTSIEDRHGNTVSMNYNPDHNLTSITDANGRSFIIELNGEGRITKITDPIGRTAIFQYGYTNSEFLVSITDMGGFTSTINYSEVEILTQTMGSVIESQITSINTPMGTSTIQYEAGIIGLGPLTFFWTFTNPNGFRSLTEFSCDNLFTGVTKMYTGCCGFKEYHVDLQNLEVTHIIFPDQSATVYYGYDENRNKNSITVGTHETQYAFDLSGNITQITDPRNKVTHLSYDANNNLESIIDPMGRTANFEYDDYDNMISSTTNVSAEHFEYYANGNLLSYLEPNGNETLYNYDGFGYLSEINYPMGNPSIFNNDEAGRPVSKTENGVELNFAYDDFNQTTLKSFPDGTEINYIYDFMRTAEINDRGRRKSTYEYDGTNLIIKTVGPQGDVDYIRDSKGNVTRLVINGVTTSYLYDEMDRMVQMTNPDGTSKYYTYDELGNLSTRLDENGTLTTYTYDYNLLTQIDYGDDTADVQYTYNDNGEDTTMTDATGTTTYTHDNGGRLTYIDRPRNDGDMTYTYDAAGNRLSMSIPDMDVGYEYDNMNRLTNVASSFASANYQYDENNNLIKKSIGNGSYTDYAYDDLNRLLTLQNKKSTGEIFSGFDYTYDDASMIKTILDDKDNLYSYEYDYGYQLTEEKVEDAGGHILWHDQFTYDNMGNRLTENKNGIIDYYENNINNQLVSLKKQTNNVTGLIYGDTAVKVFVNNTLANLTYFGDTVVEFAALDIPLQFTSDTGYFVAHANGVLAEVDDSSRFVVQAKKYPNREIYLSISDDTTRIPPENINMITRNYETIFYNYDPNGNLVERLTPFDTTTYAFDAENRLIKVELPRDYFEEYEYDGKWQRTKIGINGISDKEYVYDNSFEAVKINTNGELQYFLRGVSLGGGIGGLIAANLEMLDPIYNFYNQRGDVISNIDDSESVTYSADYAAFGDERNLNGENNHNFKYSTKEYDVCSGFSYFGNRYFSLEMGRWISKDPIGLKGGVNLYGYTKNNPVNTIDIDGNLGIVFTITVYVLLVTVSTSIIAPYALSAKCGKFQDDFMPELDIPGDEKPIPNYYRFPPPQQLRFK